MGSTSYSYDRADRITSVGTVSYTVDANGNLVARGADSFGYDQANRLKGATVNGAASSYAYDGGGKRTSKTVGAATTSYLYDVNASLPVLLDDGSRKYVWGLGLAYAVDNAGNPLVYHTDGLGSVRALTDANGNVAQSYQYDEYGVPTSSQGSINQPFRYTGEQYDPETGLVHLRARYYEAGSGRFVSRDPSSGTIGEPETLNRYGYVANNPILLSDPSGMVFMVPVPRKPRNGGIKDDVVPAPREFDDSDLLIMMSVGPQGLLTATAGTIAKTAQLVGHHTIPKEILKGLPDELARLVRGKRGDPNIWRVPEELHIDIHQGPGGGLYNAAWKDAIGNVLRAGDDLTPEAMRGIRDELVRLFGLEGYRP